MSSSLRILPLVLLLCGTSLASSLIKKDLGQLAREAQRIVHGRVIDSRAAWDAERRLIWTRYTLLVRGSWKGDALRTIVVHEPGGIVGDTGQRVSGSPQYRVGEERVLFLTRDPLGWWRTLGSIQGAFRVQDRVDGTPGIRFARGLSHVTKTVFPGTRRPSRIGVGLAEFKAAVVRLAAAPAKKTEGR